MSATTLWPSSISLTAATLTPAWCAVPNEASTLDRFADSIHQVLGRLPECEVAVLSSAEVAFRWHGLEFARISHEPASFRSGQEIAFGVGAEERVLDDRNAPTFDDLIRARPEGPPSSPAFSPASRALA
jgi:hypothetical protein